MYMAFVVIKARKKFSVKYPQMYADESNKNAAEFNCIQRAHQNSLENLASFYAFLGLAGFRYPISGAVAGAAYLLGRIAYFMGYCGGGPQGRHRGGFLHLGMFALVGMVCRWSVELLRSA